MKATLPPPRDLPPVRREQIRNTLTRTVERDTTGTRRWHRPALMATAAAAALILVVGVVTWQVGGTLPDRVNAAQPAVPGYSPDDLAEMTERCIGDEALIADYAVYNVTRIDGQDVALLYGTDQGQPTSMLCSNEGQAKVMNPVTDLDWMQRDGTIDVADNVSGQIVLAGRFQAPVARVTGSKSADASTPQTAAALANGTYIVHVPGARSADEGHITTWDANGNGISQFGAIGDDWSCAETPDGKLIAGNRTGDERCEPAIRWTRGK